MFRSGVRAELGDAVEVVGEADEVAAAVELINERLPDVVLLDVHLPGGGGQAVLGGVIPHHPEVQFLALSVSDAPEDVIARHPGRGPGLRDQDHLRSRAAPGRVPGGCGRRRVLAPAGRLRPRRLRRRVPAPSLAPGSIPSSTSSRPGSGRCCASSPAGYTYKEVARDLTISAKTVESHVSSVLRKLQLSTRHELTKWATDRRLV